MSLLSLKLNTFRNFSQLEAELNPRVNLIYGENGSGKTSILEAIHYLGLGRSFRTHLSNRAIQYDASSFTIFGIIESESLLIYPVGVEKAHQSKLKIKIGQELSSKSVDLAKLFPIQIINPESFNLLTEGPQYRRQFLDWGVFHVEHGFYSTWQKFFRILKQRNSALQQQVPKDQIQVWDSEFVIQAKKLNEYRLNYLELLIPVFNDVLNSLGSYHNLTIEYQPGWDQTLDLAEIIIKNFFQDRQFKYTHSGPQRADLKIRINNIPAEQILSRGEQKILVFAFRIAQSKLMSKLSNKTSVYLIDDLSAELDRDNRNRVIKLLSSLKSQLFLTGIESSYLESSLENLDSYKEFHVKHGKLE